MAVNMASCKVLPPTASIQLAMGTPVLRTLSFAAGFVAQVLLVLAIFKLI
jgi:tetrahydromethanopterin S-methyltransferase subunit F